MGNVRLTKSQRRRANEKRRKQASAQFDQQMGPVPTHIDQYFTSIAENTNCPIPREQREPWELAPAHMVDFCETPTVNDLKLKRLSATAGKFRTSERDVRIGAMRANSPDLWCIRGKAHLIAARHAKEDGEMISVRTIQDYIKITKI